NLRAIRQHVHGGAAGKRQRCRGVEIHTGRQADQRAGRNQNFFREPAVALHTENLATQTERFLAAPAELALAAKNIGLDRDAIAALPILHGAPVFGNRSGNFTAWSARKLERDGQAGFFEPEIEVIEAAGFDLNDDFIRTWPRLGEITEFELSG